MAKILVVDDDPDLTDACQLVLEQAGHEVQVAHSSVEGMSAVTSFAPDLLILDVMMAEPDDGIAMAQRLRRGGFDAPILLLTSISKVTGMEYGRDDVLVPVDDFIEKPVSPATLVDRVGALLAGKGAD
jgi:DNA-binding response OmpR family regulator